MKTNIDVHFFDKIEYRLTLEKTLTQHYSHLICPCDWAMRNYPCGGIGFVFIPTLCMSKWLLDRLLLICSLKADA